MWGVLSYERTGLSFARVTVSSNKSFVTMYNLHFTIELYFLHCPCLGYVTRIQKSFFMYTLSRERVYTRRCLAIAVFSDFAILCVLEYVTLQRLKYVV
jgi:hypothetical protein